MLVKVTSRNTGVVGWLVLCDRCRRAGPAAEGRRQSAGAERLAAEAGWGGEWVPSLTPTGRRKGHCEQVRRDYCPKCARAKATDGPAPAGGRGEGGR